MLHIGQLIESRYHERGIKVSFFAKAIGTSERNVYKIFEKTSIDTQQLLRISKVLDYDFFQHYSGDKLFNAAEPKAEYKLPKKRRVMVEIEVTDKEYRSFINRANNTDL